MFLIFLKGWGLDFPSSSQTGDHRWAWRWMLRLVRDSKQSAKQSAAVRGQARRGSYSGKQTSAGCGRAKSQDFLPVRFCGRSRVDLLLAQQSVCHASSFMCTTHAECHHLFDWDQPKSNSLCSYWLLQFF
jgi:hypothetical protein